MHMGSPQSFFRKTDIGVKYFRLAAYRGELDEEGFFAKSSPPFS